MSQLLWLDRVVVECTCLLHCPTVTLQLHNFDLFRTCRTGLVVQVVSALLCDNWQDFNWHDASRGPSAIAEFLLRYSSSTTFQHFTVFAPATVLFLWREKLKRDKCSDFSVVISLRRYIVHLEDAAGGVSNSTTYNNCYSKPDSDKPRAT